MLIPMRKGNSQANPSKNSSKPTVRNRRPADVDEDLEFDVNNKYVTQKIPEGTYQAVFIRVERAEVFKAEKIFVWVRITEPGPFHGTELYRAYRVHHLPGKSKKYLLKPRSELRQMLLRLNEVKVRADRVSLKILKNKVLKVTVRTVKKDYRQRALDECDQYSVVEDILSFETA